MNTIQDLNAYVRELAANAAAARDASKVGGEFGIAWQYQRERENYLTIESVLTSMMADGSYEMPLFRGTREAMAGLTIREERAVL